MNINMKQNLNNYIIIVTTNENKEVETIEISKNRDQALKEIISFVNKYKEKEKCHIYGSLSFIMKNTKKYENDNAFGYSPSTFGF